MSEHPPCLPTSEEQWFARILQNREETLRWIFSQMTSEQLAVAAGPQKALQHFQRICTVETAQLMAEVEANEELFALSTRQSIKVQEHTETIFLRRPDHRTTPLKSSVNVQETMVTEHWARFPVLTEAMESFAREYGKGTLGMAMVVRLKPGSQVHPHYDRGLYYAARDRYHFVLRSQGSHMRCGGADETWKEGEAWWFNNKLVHSAENCGDDWRVHVIFDVLPDRNRAMSHRMKEWANMLKIE
jgi:aspartyl/asparaginyl beta-hydroxylase (cupin superfamily)